MERFCQFLKSLETPDNKTLLEAIYRGYQAVFEYPHATIQTPRSGVKFVDLHLEDMLEREGKEKTLDFINFLLNSLQHTNQTIPIKYAMREELKRLPKPIDHLDEIDRMVWINELKIHKNRLERDIEPMPA